MRQLHKTFPGHPAFTPSNSVIWLRSSKYATSERFRYAASEQRFQGPAAGGGAIGRANAPPRLVRRFVLGHDVRGDPATLIHLVAVRPRPLADSRALLAASPVALTATAKLRAA
jgi:hypothetical protein